MWVNGLSTSTCCPRCSARRSLGYLPRRHSSGLARVVVRRAAWWHASSMGSQLTPGEGVGHGVVSAEHGGAIRRSSRRASASMPGGCADRIVVLNLKSQEPQVYCILCLPRRSGSAQPAQASYPACSITHPLRANAAGFVFSGRHCEIGPLTLRRGETHSRAVLACVGVAVLYALPTSCGSPFALGTSVESEGDRRLADMPEAAQDHRE
jgi:hypothetical protein